MKPATRRVLLRLMADEWVSGNELFQVGGTRYGARLFELEHDYGYRHEKRWIRGSRVPLYRLLPPEPVQLTLEQVAS